jgi:FkbM family methyltransferase
LRARTWLAIQDGAIGAELLRLDEYLPVERRRVALDIGANNGMTAFVLSKLFEQVHAFEPNGSVLDEWIHAAPPNLQTWNVALSDEDAEGELKVPVIKGVALNGWASLDSPNIENVDQFLSTRVVCRRLDDVMANESRIDFIKIDVEGHELSVLRGAAWLLRRCRPWLVIESWTTKRDQVVEYLTGLGYRIVDLRHRLGLQAETQDLVFCP